MTLRLVSAEAIVSWVFGSEGVSSIADESQSALSWEILFNAVNKCIARVQVRWCGALLVLPCFQRNWCHQQPVCCVN